MSSQRGVAGGEFVPYPTGMLQRLMQLPVLLYRLGLGRVVGFLPIMILVTRGRRSGLARATPLEYRTHGSKVYVISGWGQRPHWLQNLLAEPLVTLQMSGRSVAARGRLVDSHGEAARALSLFRRNVPWAFDAAFSRITGTVGISPKSVPDLSSAFTVVRLDRLPDEPLPLRPVQPDLAWILPIGLFTGVMTVALLVFARTRRS